MGETIRESFTGTWMGEGPKLGMQVRSSKNNGYFCQYMWMTLKRLVKKQKKAPMWKELMKDGDIEEPTSFLDHVYSGCTQRACKPNVYLGCTQRECKPNEKIFDAYRHMFEFLLQQLKNYLGGKNLTQRRLRGPTEGHAQKNALRETVNW